MARIFPNDSPQNTGSRTAEPIIHRRLKEQLSDEFVVIHSLPWLASVAKEIDGRSVPTGEIDFLVLHQKLGILAIEVKGGIFTYNRTEFVYKRTGQRIDPVRQIRRGVHALSKLLHESGAGSWRIGYCLIFPESEMQESIPISLIDLTIQPPQPIVLDVSHLDNLGSHIQAVMTYWQKSLGTWEIKTQQFEKLIDVLLPSADYTPCWQTKINNDIVTWLQLTPAQTGCLNKITQENRLVVTGFPGTGKTLLLVEHVRRLSKSGKKALVLTYNSLLAKRIRHELSDIGIEVYTFHEQCRQAARLINNSIPLSNRSSNSEVEKEWYLVTAPNMLQQAFDEKILSSYDSLVIDEGQVFHVTWWQILAKWFDEKQITVFCDSTQVFSFESSTLPIDIAETINAKSPYILTVNLRSPRAIFERVAQVKSTNYQQSCLRPFDPDTLSEIVVEDTMNALDKVIHQLEEEGISKQSIILINASSGSWKENNYLGIETVNASKFRGLESSVVIILAGHGSDETSLFCAYTRATSRCIVIYDAVELVKGTYENFGKIISDLDKTGNIQNEANLGLTSGILNKLAFSITSIADKTINLYWCSDWCAWIIPPKKFDKVAQLMWAYHLIVTTKYPVFTWDSYDRGTVEYFCSSQSINDYSHKTCNIQYCIDCEFMSPFILLEKEIEKCVICSCEKHAFMLSGAQASFDNILSPHSGASPSDKKKLSIFLIALGRWNTIPYKHRQKFSQDVLVGGSMGYQVAHLLVLTDLLKKKDLIFKLDEMAGRYRSLWCPDLEMRIDKDSWKKTVSLGISRLLQKKALIKISTGVYEKSKEFLDANQPG